MGGGTAGARTLSAVTAILRDQGVGGFFRGWFPAYMREARMNRLSAQLSIAARCFHCQAFGSTKSNSHLSRCIRKEFCSESPHL